MAEYIGLYRIFSTIGYRYRAPIIFQIFGLYFEYLNIIKKFENNWKFEIDSTSYMTGTLPTEFNFFAYSI